MKQIHVMICGRKIFIILMASPFAESSIHYNYPTTRVSESRLINVRIILNLCKKRKLSHVALALTHWRS